MGDDVKLLDKWYISDTNNIPAVSVLQPIDTHLKNFLNKKEPTYQAKDAAAWWMIQSKLQEMLRKAAKALFINEEFSEDEKHNYFMSVTEREVLNGCVNVKNVKVYSILNFFFKIHFQIHFQDHVIVYNRNINNINLQNSKRASAFIDMIENKVDQEAFNLLNNYRDNKAAKKMEKNGGVLQKYNVEWVGRDGLNPDTHEAYLTEFVNHFYKNVVKMIDRAMKRENINNDTPLVYEILYHLHECNRSAEDFVGRELELRKIKNCLLGDSNHPFFVFGKGGSGKTGLLSKVFQCSRSEWIQKGNP